jgi:hypothetical protein
MLARIPSIHTRESCTVRRRAPQLDVWMSTFGLQRFFTNNTLTCFQGACVAGSTVMSGTPAIKTTFGAGVGGSVLLPLIPEYLEFTGSVAGWRPVPIHQTRSVRGPRRRSHDRRQHDPDLDSLLPIRLKAEGH